METLKFSHLNASSLKLSYLSGLAGETLQQVEPSVKQLGAVGEDTYAKLNTDLSAMDAVIDRARSSALTAPIREANDKCDATLNEIKRTVKADSQSTLTEKAQAGATLLHFLEGFWHLNKEALPSQIRLTRELLRRFYDTPEATAAADTLGLLPLFTALGTQNLALETLYHERLDQESQAAPAATHLKLTVADGYTKLCGIVLQAANLHPEDETLTTLFLAMDAIRKKYSALLPAKIDLRDAAVDPIPNQTYTGKPVTPIPSARYGDEDLVFAKDFTVTYRHNVEPGSEATVTLHGKGRFSGQHERTFIIGLITG
ncbi:MAG: DUF6261 family protein [Tannerella sp.]|nr:DUF6261 family protein [Tannerella sp.]